MDLPVCAMTAVLRAGAVSSAVALCLCLPATAPAAGTHSFPFNAEVMGGTVYFSADDTLHGRELWKSDGTAGGTSLVHDIRPGVCDASGGAALLTAVNGTLFFIANDGLTGTELWKSDGTSAGTTLVKDIFPGATSSMDGTDAAANVNGTLFFTASDPPVVNYFLWTSDGTEAGTARVTGAPIVHSNIVDVGGLAFFQGCTNASGCELWKSDGSTVGTTLVEDIYPTAGSSAPDHLTSASSVLFFTADDGTAGRELWTSDGSAAGTVRIKDINPGAGDAFAYLGVLAVESPFTSIGGDLVFAADDGVHGLEPWTSDGSDPGTALVRDVNPGPEGSVDPSNQAFVPANGTIFFVAFEPATGLELWKTDGTGAGTLLVKDIYPGGATGVYSAPFAVGSNVFFAADDGVNGVELWKSDGSTAGTALVKDIRLDAPSSFPFALADLGGALVFSADDGVSGAELWTSDGTAAGTVLLKDISGCLGATSIKSTLLLKNDSPDDGDLLKWKWTTPATVTVSDFGTPSGSTDLTLTLCHGNQEKLNVTAPAGGTCGARDCWSATATGFTYRDADLTPDGVLRVKLKAGSGGTAKILVKGKGGNLEMPSVSLHPQDGPVSVHLRRSDGAACWSGSYGNILVFDENRFKARSD